MKNEKEKKDEKKEAKKEGKKVEKNEKLLSKENLPWIAAFIVIVIIAYVVIQASSTGKGIQINQNLTINIFQIFGLNTRSYVLDGMRVEYESSMTADEGLKLVLSQDPQIVRLETVNASDSRNSMVAIIAAETIRGIAYANRTVAGYAAVYQPDNLGAAPTLINCDANNSNCGTPTIIIKYGSCNCLKILPSQKQLVIEGDKSFATTHASKVGQIIAMVESEIANSTTAG